VGWGKTQFVVRRTEDDKITWDQSQHSDQLKYAKVRYRGGRIRAVTIDEKEYEGRKLYADWNEEDGARPLQGDSGGPLVCKNPGGEDVLCGLLRKDKRKIKLEFASTAEHLVWINEKIEEKAEQEKAEEEPNGRKRKPPTQENPGSPRNKQRRRETEGTRLSMAGAIVTGLAAILLAYRRG